MYLLTDRQCYQVLCSKRTVLRRLAKVVMLLSALDLDDQLDAEIGPMEKYIAHTLEKCVFNMGMTVMDKVAMINHVGDSINTIYIDLCHLIQWVDEVNLVGYIPFEDIGFLGSN